MDTQNITLTATQNVAQTVSVKITKEEAQQKSDGELLQMIKDSKGHTGNDFSDYMNCDFSYSYLTSLISDRGYENGWHKVTDTPSSTPKPVIIQMKKSDEEVSRQSYMIEKSVAKEWKEFNQNVPYKTVTLGHALRRFMSDVKSGRIKFELKI